MLFLITIYLKKLNNTALNVVGQEFIVYPNSSFQRFCKRNILPLDMKLQIVGSAHKHYKRYVLWAFARSPDDSSFWR